MSRVFSFILFIIVLYACTTGESSRAIPKATGRAGDMIILMDSLQWKGELGQEISNIFYSDVSGIPGSETVFNVKRVHPSKKIKLLTQVRNLVYVFTLDQKGQGTRAITDNLSKETIDQIYNDSSFYLVTRKNEYSEGQEVMYLFGKNEEQLLHHLRRNGRNIQAFFNRAERQRLVQSLKNTTSTKSFAELLAKQYKISVNLSVGYKIAQNEKNFTWFRSPEAEIDRNFFITSKPYLSEYQLLPDSLIAWRNSICMQYLFEDPDQLDSFLTTEQEVAHIPVKAKQVDLNGRFAMELRGLWRTNKHTMGGPFVSYTFVNKADNRLYYMEGFVYCPGKPKRELIREMEAIAYTLTDAPVPVAQ